MRQLTRVRTGFPRDLFFAVAIGVAYYCTYTSLVGIAAAIAFPDWYVAFAKDNKAIALLLFRLVTILPAAALASALAGFAISRTVNSDHVTWAVLIVVGATAFAAGQLHLNRSFVDSLWVMVLPSSMIDVPLIIAWWVFLPLSVAVFSRRFQRDSTVG